jgi:hypothetical protein
MTIEPESNVSAEETPAIVKQGVSVLQVIGWFSMGMAVAALGIVVGAELRSRSRFKKRTPYDFYANAGEQQAGEFGVGV